MKYLSKAFVSNVVILMTALFFLFGCSGTKPATKPTPTEQPTAEKAKKEEPASKPPSKPETVTPAKPSPPPPPPPPPTPKATPTPPLRMAKVVWTAVNLRQGPGMNHKVIGTAKQGMTLGVLEVKGDWLRVRLEDGNEAWVSKAATSEAPKAPPPSSPPATTTKPTTPSKPAPM